MEKILYKANNRGFEDYGWLQSYHSFSFGKYYDPRYLHFGMLRVINDDTVQPGKGFQTHSHKNMEIISIPLQGKLTHKDSVGHEHVIQHGEVQIFSAGTGVSHSEFNYSKGKNNFLQIWILPEKYDVPPRYQQKGFPIEKRHNQWQRIVSPEKSYEPLWINQDAYLHLAIFDKDKEFRYELINNKHLVYVFLISGRIEIMAVELHPRDALGIKYGDYFEGKALKKSEILVIEVPA